MRQDYYVYVHRRLSDGLIFYVGKGTGYRHAKKTSTQRSDWWVRTAEKHGHQSEIFRDRLTEKEAFDAERELIAVLREQGQPLVNMTDGGEGASGFVMSDETKDKIREFLRDKNIYTFGFGLDELFSGTRNEFSEFSGLSSCEISCLVSGAQKTSKGWWVGCAPDTVIRSAMFGPKVSSRLRQRQSVKRPVYCSDGCKYPDLRTAAKYGASGMSMNAAACCIKKCCEGYMGSYAGKSWSYSESVPAYVSRYERCALTQGKKVIRGDGMRFPSVSHAARYVAKEQNRQVTRANISNCCNGRIKTSYGYTWRFADEP